MEEKYLVDICNPKQWKTIPKSELIEDGEFPVYGANGIIGRYNKYNHEKPTVLITCRGATCGNIHITVPKSYINGNAMSLDDLNESKCKKEYLYYFLKYYDLSKIISGTAQPQITINGLKKVKVKLYSIEKQEKIVEELNKINKLIDLKKRQLEELSGFIKSQFVEMFGNGNYPQIRLQEVLNQNDNMEKVENTKIEKFVTVGINGKGARERIIKDGKWPVPFVGYRVKGGQFIYSRIDARNGAFAIIPNYLNNAVVSKDFPIFDIDYNKIKPDILLFSLLEESFIDIIKNSSFGATNRQRIKERTFLNYKIYLPPIDLQNQFAEIVKQIDKQKFEIEKSLKETQELYESLMEKYFG